jgi:hypothetical protein
MYLYLKIFKTQWATVSIQLTDFQLPDLDYCTNRAMTSQTISQTIQLLVHDHGAFN